MEKELTCIRCPLGCLLHVDLSGGTIVVSGNSCPRGQEYGISEVTNPVRMVTGTVTVTGGTMARVSVKTAAAVPKKLVLAVAKEIRAMKIAAPVKEGEILSANIAGSGADLVATRTVESVRKTDCPKEDEKCFDLTH